ncbi:MAG: hypothetical protein HY836_11935 [Aquabacterium sp.]|uniref:DUF6531 domain-containing protein n=1 Tax=Aquabacterium sp. TaxID=1872578 RepID=UPI0025B92DFC|nr:DUF6531 domain-containing protein [Aquabacterium sp.]MBI5926298.1 hypothetical protein [Aquabacterium sp.]
MNEKRIQGKGRFLNLLASASLVLAALQSVHAQSSSPSSSSASSSSCGAPATGPGACVADQPASKPDPSPTASASNPINTITGNKYQREVDLPALPGVLGLEIVRHYNSDFSGLKNTNGIMGRGWKLSYETRLSVQGAHLEVIQADGRRIAFQKELMTGQAGGASPSDGKIVIRAGNQGPEYTWVWPSGRKLTFDAQGKLLQIAAPTGEFVTLQYDPKGLLIQVIDPQGRRLKLNYPERSVAEAGRFKGVQSVDSPVGRFVYEYGSPIPKEAKVAVHQLAANLVRVQIPTQYNADTPAHGLTSRGASSSDLARIYHYEDARFPTLLTGISVQGKDGKSKADRIERLATYGYDERGWAVRSVHGYGIELAHIDRADERNAGHAVLVHSKSAQSPQGQKLEIWSRQIAGAYRITETRGVACPTVVPCPEANMRYRYDDRGLVIEAIKLDAQGLALQGTRTEYDVVARPVRVTKVEYQNGKPVGEHMRVRYEYGGLPANHRQQRDEPVNVYSDKPVLIAVPSVVPGQEHKLHIEYNEFGQPTRITDTGWSPAVADQASTLLQRVTTNRYARINGRSVLRASDGPLPGDKDTTQFEWEEHANFVVQTQYPNGMRVRMERDEAGRPTVQSLMDANRRIQYVNTYLPSGKIAKSVRSAMFDQGTELREEVVQSFDVFGGLASFQDSQTGPWQIQADERGRMTSIQDVRGRELAFVHNEQDQLMAWIARDVDKSVRDGRWNFFGQQGELLDATVPRQGNAAEAVLSGFEYGENLSRPKFQHIAYQAEEPSTQPEAARFKPRSFKAAFDDFGRVVRDSSPVEGDIRYHFGMNQTGSWREKIHTDLGGQSSQRERLEFDHAGRLTKRIRGDCVERLVYEGQLVRELLGCGARTVYSRDAWGRITEQVKHVGEKVFTERFAYDASGWMNKRQLVGGDVLYYERLPQSSELKGVFLESPWLKSIRLHVSDALADAMVQALPRGWTQTTVMDMRVARFWDSQPVKWQTVGGAVIEHLHTREGRVGRITASDASSKELVSMSYRYDELGLTRSVEAQNWSLNQGAKPQPSVFQYGPQRGALIRAGMSASVRASVNVVAAGTPERFDGFGRVVERTTRKAGKPVLQGFDYDAAGRLSAVKEGGSVVATYQYDAHGDRVAKSVWAHGKSSTTYFVYDSKHRLSAEVLPDGHVNQYLYDGYAPYAMLSNGEPLAVHTDARGMPVALSDVRQQVVWRGEFDPDGNVLREEGSGSVKLRMPGQVFDEETGLYFNVNRYYDPSSGRYITPDPLGWTHGEGAYDYVGGHPLDGSDPLGLFEIPTLDFFGISSAPLTDEGHGDIVRVAFQLYAAQNHEQRFSQEIIDQIVLNNYHTDAASSIFGGGGGQFVAKNHFDNPNDGPMYLDKEMTKLNPDYNNLSWIKNSVDQLNANRGGYGLVVAYKSGVGDISEIMSSFGRSTHTLADFYAHTNWVDDPSRGGCVDNKRLIGKNEVGYVPYGLGKTEVWNEDVSDSALKVLYSGTVSLEPSAALGCINDISCSEDKTTHGYWAKDADGPSVFTDDQIKKYAAKGLKFYGVHEYEPGMSVDGQALVPEDYGVSWWAEDAATGVRKNAFADVKKGDRIYVKQDIYNSHRLAKALAIQATINEIDKLYKAAAGVKVGSLLLTDVFKMEKARLDKEKVEYDRYPAKNN